MKRIIFILACFVLMGAQVLAQQLAPYKGNARAAVSYTFDDGLIEHYTMVLPHLDALGIKGTFWIIANNIDIKKPMAGHQPMTWANVKEMAKHGHEIASHGYTHTALNEISPAQREREMEMNDSAIYQHVGVHPVSFCFPGNGRNDEIIAQVLAHKGITGARTYEKGVGGGMDVDAIDAWLRDEMEHGRWAVAMIHGITHGWDRFDNPEALWLHLQHAKALADTGQLWIATFAEVTAYQKGLSKTATYTFNKRPKRIVQKGKRLKPYKSWDGTWCVDALRGVKMTVKY